MKDGFLPRCYIQTKSALQILQFYHTDRNAQFVEVGTKTDGNGTTSAMIFAV